MGSFIEFIINKALGSDQNTLIISVFDSCVIQYVASDLRIKRQISLELDVIRVRVLILPQSVCRHSFISIRFHPSRDYPVPWLCTLCPNYRLLDALDKTLDERVIAVLLVLIIVTTVCTVNFYLPELVYESGDVY